MPPTTSGAPSNPTQVEGQIEGGIAQGIGLALMEEYLPGRTENLHDYLIPTVGDVPEIEVLIVEDPEPLGPFGAKGVGEPGLVATRAGDPRCDPPCDGRARHQGPCPAPPPACGAASARGRRERGRPVSEEKTERRAKDEGSIIR